MADKETPASVGPVWLTGGGGILSFCLFYSTVTDLARFRGLSTSQPLCTAL